uniref:endophilin-A2 isoform X2 n=1 Tax=Ciona intestinalis TaxID=7719 RepID=UPI0005219FA7|nr:endophilin-A2 isoform X2 [Ciona intestinalis]|eukprot:XP_009858316.1 endophilin-A2 isoform X2 [Ciona intestinalis]
MSLGGMKKQLNKASQYMSEKMGETEKTKMDEEFIEMERKVDATQKAVTDLINHTREYLQPNPAVRAKMNMMNKLQGKDMKYRQVEGVLGEVMVKHGTDLGHESNFGEALKEVGEGMIQLSEIKDSLDVSVKQDFIDPFYQSFDKDMKEVLHHRKKLSGRRLDYDYKRKKGSKISPEEIQLAEAKCQEALDLADSFMWNMLSSDVEQVRQLAALVEAQLEYHRQSADILESVNDKLNKQIEEINSKPEKERTKRQLRTSSIAPADRTPTHTTPAIPQASPRHTAPPPKATQPSCKAIFDFEPENEGELAFKEGEILTLVAEIDDNWFEGMSQNGDTGYFPKTYVEVVVPL